MRQLTIGVLVVFLASPGCALETRRSDVGVQLPTGARAAQLHDWAVLRCLPHGARVLVEIDSTGLLDGKLEAAGPDELTVLRGETLQRVARDAVVRVVRVDSMSAIHAKQGAIGGLLLGGILTFATGGGLWFTLLLEPPIFAGLGAVTGVGEHRQTLVYERR